jgi:hypothetical protein
VGTSADAALWLLRIRAVDGAAVIECAECESGNGLIAGSNAGAFLIAELVARVEAHITDCRGAPRRS